MVRFQLRRDTKTAALTISSPSAIHIPAVPVLLTSSTVIGCSFSHYLMIVPLEQQRMMVMICILLSSLPSFCLFVTFSVV